MNILHLSELKWSLGLCKLTAKSGECGQWKLNFGSMLQSTEDDSEGAVTLKLELG